MTAPLEKSSIAPPRRTATAPPGALAIAPQHTPSAPLTRKQAASALGVSESLIRKRLGLLVEFHSQAALITPDGLISPFGFEAIARLGQLGLPGYRELHQPCPTQETRLIIPEVITGNNGEGALAIAQDVDQATSALNQMRQRLAQRREAITNRATQRDRDLAKLAQTAQQLQAEYRELERLEIMEAAKDEAAAMVKQAIANPIGPDFGAFAS